MPNLKNFPQGPEQPAGFVTLLFGERHYALPKLGAGEQGKTERMS
jgi:hypothetical protein